MEFLLVLKVPLIVFQVVVSPILVGLILLQSGKGDDLGSALGGGGGGGSVLGTGGASKILVKATVIFAVIFMINSIALAKIFKLESSSSIGASVSEPLAPASVPTPPVPAPEGVEGAPDVPPPAPSAAPATPGNL